LSEIEGNTGDHCHLLWKSAIVVCALVRSLLAVGWVEPRETQLPQTLQGAMCLLLGLVPRH